MGTNIVMIALAVALGFLLGLGVYWVRIREAARRRMVADARTRQARRELAEQRREAAQAQALLRALLDAYPQPVAITTRERVITFANPALLALAGLPREQVIGRGAASVLQDYDTTRLLQDAALTNTPTERTFQRVTTGQTWHVVVTPLRITPSQEKRSNAAANPASIFQTGASVPLPTGSLTDRTDTDDAPVRYLILTIEDLTAIRRLETTRRDFVAHVSHELRTPLAAIKLLAETLLNALERDPDAARQFGLRIMGEIDHLTQMVNELLELSRIESGNLKLRREPTDMLGLIEVAIERMTPLAKAYGVRLHAETPDALPDALVDGERIAEALINLIDNALKYTPAGGEVTVSAEVADIATAQEPTTTTGLLASHKPTSPVADDATRAEPCPMLIVRVRDTGIGIDEDDLPRVFERFFKVDRARTRAASLPDRPTPASLPTLSATGGEGKADGYSDGRATGTGLGLAITRHLIELHGGSIWAKSRVGQGSVFSLAVPLAEE